MALFWLSVEAWAAIEPHLPKNQPGARRVDDRRVISGILHVRKVGCRWCDCPADYGPSTTVYNRFNRWSRRGFWLKLLDALVDAGAVTKSTAIDSTYIKAQRAAFSGKRGCSQQVIGRSVLPCVRPVDAAIITAAGLYGGRGSGPDRNCALEALGRFTGFPNPVF